MPCFGADVKQPPQEAVPHVTINPRRLIVILDKLRDGLTVTRVTAGGKLLPRSIVMDRTLDFITYSPSRKELNQRQLRMGDIARITTSTDETAELKKANLREEQYAVSVVTQSFQTLSVVVDSADDAHELAQALAYVVRKHRVFRDESAQRMRVIELWMEAQLNDKEQMPFEGLVDAAVKLGLTWPREVLRRRFLEIDHDGNGALNYDEFRDFVDRITLRPELKPLFLHYVNKEAALLMDAEQLKNFLQSAQGEKVSVKTAKALVQAIGTDPQNVNFGEFCQFLTNPRQNSWFKPAHQKVFMDMTQPLHHYYVAASHNTGVIGEQVNATIDPFVVQVALSSGCRCVELEVGDGREGPQIVRAYTECTPCPAQAMLSAIAESAFVASEYPVILIIEMHATKRIATMFGEMLQATFGDMLYSLDTAEKDDYSKFSPATLKHKILLMYKLDPEEPESRKDVSQCPRLAAVREASAETNVAAAELCQLAFLTPRQHDHDWGKDAEQYFVGSYPEERVDLAYTKKRFKFTAMNRRMFTRAYPTREDSSNLDPQKAFALGVPIVAMNYQTWDENMRLYDGRFNTNGRCGYLLKPEYLRNASVLPTNQPYLLTVNVLLGTQLPPPESQGANAEPRYKVCLRLTGAPEDAETNAPRHTRALTSIEASPFWNETFEFTVTNIELAAITIRVTDEEELIDNDIGEAVTPLLSLRLGYRAVPLFSCHTGRALPHASVLCHFRIRRTDDVEEVLEEWLSNDVGGVVS
jgi:phosphatidylinositol phospholipase C delta